MTFTAVEFSEKVSPRGWGWTAHRGRAEDAEVEAVLRGAAGRPVLLYLPTYSPWLNPVEVLWRQSW